jgi:hypothetical protein
LQLIDALSADKLSADKEGDVHQADYIISDLISVISSVLSSTHVSSCEYSNFRVEDSAIVSSTDGTKKRTLEIDPLK